MRGEGSVAYNINISEAIIATIEDPFHHTHCTVSHSVGGRFSHEDEHGQVEDVIQGILRHYTLELIEKVGSTGHEAIDGFLPVVRDWGTLVIIEFDLNGWQRTIVIFEASKDAIDPMIHIIQLSSDG